MAKKIKGKDWFTIIAPKIFNEKVLGETPADDTKKLISRTIEVPYITLTNDMSKFYIKVKFRITKVDNNKAYTEVAGMECLRDYLARMIRHGINRIDTIQRLKTQDGRNVAIKCITVTNKRVTKGIEKKISDFVKKVIEKSVTESKLDDFLSKIFSDSLKNKILKEGSKIYPLRNFDVRRLEVR
ncbi:MAG: hypothetical protein ACK4MM_03155 [Fervidobacterium sp.]